MHGSSGVILPVRRRQHGELLPECRAELADVRVADGSGNFRNGLISRFQQVSSEVEAVLPNPGGNRVAITGAKIIVEGGNADVKMVGNILYFIRSLRVIRQLVMSFLGDFILLPGKMVKRGFVWKADAFKQKEEFHDA